jgi:hypothetical protein
MATSDRVSEFGSNSSHSESRESLIGHENTVPSSYERFMNWWNTPDWVARIIASVSSGQERSASIVSLRGHQQLSTTTQTYTHLPAGDAEHPASPQESNWRADCGQAASAWWNRPSYMAACRLSVSTMWTNSNCCADMSNRFRTPPPVLSPTILALPYQTPQGHAALSDAKNSSGQELTEVQQLHVETLDVLTENSGLTLDEQTAKALTQEVRDETAAMVNTLWWVNLSTALGGAYVLGCFYAYKVLTDKQIANESETYSECLDHSKNSDADAVKSNCRVSAQLTQVEDMTDNYESNYIIYGVLLAVPAVALVIFVLERIYTLVIAPCLSKKAEGVRRNSGSVDHDAQQVVQSTVRVPLLSVKNDNQVVQFTSLQAIKDVVADGKKRGQHKLGVASAFLALSYAKPLLARQQQYASLGQARGRLAVVLLTACFISALASMKIYSVSVADESLPDCEDQNANLDDVVLYDTNVYNCIENAIFDAITVKDGVRVPVMGVEDGLLFLLAVSAISLLFSAKELAVRAMPTFSNVPELLAPQPSAAAEEVAEDGLQGRLEQIRDAAALITPLTSKLAAGGNEINPGDLQGSIDGYSDACGVPDYLDTAVALRDVVGRQTIGMHVGGGVLTHDRSSEYGVADADVEMELTNLLNDFAQALRGSGFNPRDITQGDAMAIMATHEVLMRTVNAMYEVPMDPTHQQAHHALARVLIKMSNAGVQVESTAPAGGFFRGERPAPVVTGLKLALESVLQGELDTSVTAGAALVAVASLSSDSI